MNKFLFGTGLLVMAAAFAGCGAGGDNPGSAYMPDMYYSRAYETYGYNNVEGEYDSLRRRGINFTSMPVPGTVARGEHFNYWLTADSAGLQAAQSLKNPFDTMAVTPATAGMMKEAERLYLVNCGICHGTNLDGNGPLYNNGNGPYPAKPRELNGDYTRNLTDGHVYHVITFGKGAMGSYSSQLTPEQRWWVIKYMRAKGGAAKDTTAAPAAVAAPAAAVDTTNSQTNPR
ncbi:MAG TPA: cytochrome c [Flavisolibacter sp.]